MRAERNRLAVPAAGAGDDRRSSIRSSPSARWCRNPIDGGFGVLTSADNYMASIEALQADPNVDIVLLQEALPREAGSDRAESYIRDGGATTRPPKPRSRSPSSRRPRTARPTTAARCAPRRRTSRSCRRPTRRCARSPASARRDELERLAPRAGGESRPRDAGAARDDRDACAARAGASRWRSTRCNPRTCCAPTASRRRPRRWSPRRPRRSRPPSASAIRSCSRRCPTRSRTSPMSGAVALNLATPEELTAAYERMAQKLRDARARRHAGLPAGARRARARARPASRSRDGPRRDGRRAAACCSN